MSVFPGVYLKLKELMIMKKKNGFMSMKRRIEDAMFNVPAASANDATGFSNTLPDSDFEAEEKAALVKGSDPYGKRKEKSPRK